MFSQPLSLSAKQISAEIHWAVCYGYIAGKNGHMLWLSRLEGVGCSSYSKYISLFILPPIFLTERKVSTSVYISLLSKK